MPMSKAGKKIMSNLKKEYGEKKGEGVFYAMENQGRIPGMKKKGYQVGGQVPTQKQPAQSSNLSQMQAQRRMEAQRMANSAGRNQAGRGATAPGQMQAAQARRAALGRQNVTDTATNQRNLAMAQKRNTSRMTTAPGQMQTAQAQQVGMSQARRVAASQQKPSATSTNQRNLAMAQARNAAANQKAAPKARRNPFSRSGMAKGGMVKSTGKMNTGIKKCGE